MDIDDLKQAWQSLDQRLQKQHERQLDLLRETRLQKVRSGMLPLALAHIGTMALGMLGIAVLSHDPPSSIVSWPVWLCTMICAAYFLGIVGLSFLALARYGEIDYAAPVVHIQEQLARLRNTHVKCGMFAGLPWFVLWLPFGIVMLYNFTGVDIGKTLSTTYWLANIGVGAIGIGGAWALYRWARRNPGTPFAAKIIDTLSGATLRRAQAELDELKRFLED